MDCSLPATGGSSLLTGGLGLILVSAGVVLAICARRRRFVAGAAVIIALVCGAAAIATLGANRADAAAACPPTTTSAVGNGGGSVTTTAASSTTAAATTTTAVATTTTTVAVPDLTPTIDGPQLGFSADYTITITNIGDAPAAGPMTFTLTLAILNGAGPLVASNVTSTDWTLTDPSGLTFTANDGLVIAPGATSIITLLVEWQVEAPGSWQGTVSLPTGIGGETNATNNSDSIVVVIPPPPG